MLGFGSRANLASASASASAPGCRPILRKKKFSRLRRELLQVQAEKLAYVSSALFGPYVCLGNLTTTMFRLGPQQRINIGPGFGLCFGPGLGPGISAQVPGSMRARVDCRPFASAAGEKRGNRPTSSASISVRKYVNILAPADLGLVAGGLLTKIRHAVRIRTLAWSCSLTKVGRGLVSRQLLMDVSPKVP